MIVIISNKIVWPGKSDVIYDNAIIPPFSPPKLNLQHP